jgi:hypothetical protein
LIAAGIQPRPGTQRRHVFDFADGVRLIVSRDRMVNGREDICVSGSMVPNSAAQRKVGSEDVETRWCDLVTEKWHALAGSDQVLELMGWSAGKGVPHFVVRQPALIRTNSVHTNK